MKYVALLIAGVALAGCDITLGANGPVITQSDSVISRIAPIGNRTTTTAPQTTATGDQTAAASTQVAGDATPPRSTANRISISDITGTTALPLGVTRSHVETFKAAVADEGCLISTRQEREAVQSRTGFTDERMDRIIGYVWRVGDLERRSGSYELTTGRCADA